MKSKPNMLYLDIETAPDVVWTWSVYDSNAIAVKDHWYVLSFAAKWRGQRDVIVKGLCDYKGYRGGSSTERALLKDIHKLLSDADIIVAHNGRDFDVKKLNARFIFHGFTPPPPYKVVDTRRDLARVAKFSSNKLDWLAKQLDIGSKIEHEGFPMWQGCMLGDRGWWKKMLKYNRHDVNLLEELYNIISPWIDQPNAGAWVGPEVCPNPACASDNLESRGWARTKTRTYKRFQCRECGTWGRAVRSERSTKVTRAI